MTSQHMARRAKDWHANRTGLCTILRHTMDWGERDGNQKAQQDASCFIEAFKKYKKGKLQVG